MTIAEKIARAKADYDAVFEAGKKSVLSVLDFTDIESTSYRVTVPSGADDFARVNKIGGMTHKTRNLIPFPYNTDSKTEKGITFAINENGIVTINGTATEEGNFYFINPWAVNPNYISVNGTYTLSGISGGDATTYYLQIYVDGSNKGVVYTNPVTFTASGTVNQFSFFYKAGAVFNNFVISPMLNEGTTALPYEPYFDGIRNAEVTELKSDGVNYLDISAGLNDVFVDNGDGTYSAITNETSNRFSKEIPLNIPIGQSVVICGESVEGAIVYGKIGNDTQWQTTFYLNGNGYIRKSTAENPITKVIFFIDNSDRGKTTKFKNPMIALGETKVPYKAYVGNIDTLPIPEEIKSLDGYGLGVNSECYNYIDFERKVFVQNVYRKVFDGTEYISKGTNGVGVTRFIVSTDLPANNASNVVNVVCNHYNPSSIYETNDYAENRLGASASAIRWVDAELLNGTEDEMKAKLKAWYDEGNPLIVDYVLAEPIETDISAYLTDEYIEVEGGGTVTVVNEYGLDAPTNISYLIDTQGG